MNPTDDHGRNSLSEGGWGVTGAARLAVGLVQGLLLAWLIHSASGGDTAANGQATRLWPATHPALYGPLILVAAYLPPVLLAGIGRLRLVTLLAWGVGAGLLLAFLGWSDIARQSVTESHNPPFLDFPLLPFAAAALFIGHHLILPADRERRLIAAFPTYFDTAWLAGVQLALSLGFTLAFWLLLNLGAALFGLIGIRQLNDLLQETWFIIPLLSLAFALAVQLTDVRPGLIRGVRTVALMLLSWLLLVMTVLVGGFLAALPFTGMEGLWKTGSATALVLAAAGALIILINTAYQDGLPDNRPPAVLRAAVRVAAVLITPLIGIAVWGLSLRIGQYGLTPDRIIAAACVLVGLVYAAGYGWAALSPFWRGGDWMKPLERTNVFAAVLTVLVIVCLFTPIADPARLSVASQVARLNAGQVAPDRFDYRFLRFDSGRAGEAALARLARSDNAEIARRARDMQAETDRYSAPDTTLPAVTPVFEVHPAGSAAPQGLIAPVTIGDPRARCVKAGDCVVTQVDLNGDGVAEALIATAHSVEMFQKTDRGWASRGAFRTSYCGDGARNAVDPRQMMREGRIAARDPLWPDLNIGDVPARLDRWPYCDGRP
ncbi:MAG: DUF4153 domain-containing protein [Brevundimonas sp.]|uniref:DUF4153 domain-containing protein n=1 Tax=Brevundimonas sp. TaxID=1871086 RepID=UPI0025B94B98|nr:DUF4153 domain-containing protein [Brevundimonas sp.]MBX3476323.1 DUF4153 domain-containing protein [Brevundimonas sp.]